MTTMDPSSSTAITPAYSGLETSSSSMVTGSSNPSPPSKASGSTAKPATLNRRQHAAHKARILAVGTLSVRTASGVGSLHPFQLSKQLTTRMQYAAFKVEHGWTKQSLSEVENLYYRHCKATSSGSASGPNRSPSSIRKSSIPSTPKLNSKGSGLTPTGTTRQGQSGQGGAEIDVFGGLMTPPASGGNFPASHTDRERETLTASFASVPIARQRSPTAGLEAKGTSSAAKQGKSYADFWSKIGTAGPASGPGNERQ